MKKKIVHHNNHIFVIKDIFEKPSSGTMALMGSIKMKPETYKKSLTELEKIVSPEVEMEFRITTYAPGASEIRVKPTFLSRLLTQGFFNEKKIITFSQLYDIFKLIDLVEETIQKKSIDVEFKKIKFARSFFGTVGSIYKLNLEKR